MSTFWLVLQALAWLVLAGLSAVFVFSAVMMSYMSLGFMGRLSPVAFVYLIPAAALGLMAWSICPFSIGGR